MKRTIKVLCVVVTFTFFTFTANEKASAQYSQSDECSKKMAEETAGYIRQRRIALKSSASEFYSNKDEQIYLLSSEEKVNLNTTKPQRRTAAVINYKAANKNAGFYVVESEFRPDSVIYSIKRDSVVTLTLTVNLVKPEPGDPNPADPFCDNVKQQSISLLAQAQKEANETCTQRMPCIPICANSQITGYSLVLITPQDYACVTTTTNNQSYFRKRIERALEKDALLFTYSRKK